MSRSGREHSILKKLLLFLEYWVKLLDITDMFIDVFLLYLRIP